MKKTSDNFLIQLIEKPVMELRTREGLIGKVKTEGGLGCRDHEMVALRTSRGAKGAGCCQSKASPENAQTNRLVEEVPEDWRKANATPPFEIGRSSVSLSWKPAEARKQLILGTNSRYMKEEKVIQSSQHGFIKRVSCLTSLITFYDYVSYEKSLEQRRLVGNLINVFIFPMRRQRGWNQALPSGAPGQHKRQWAQKERQDFLYDK
ncbi:hypothetical protein WISP_30597 [Willisornis vidua]|uniref:Uncharacterized protein n=1 Tax=Willisornis vidua TaxID=1566151 RepID=A0ABQ9DLL3_9PASS|nr:hypothetical protein WISP_30597 [Willisornis vidua]